MAGPSCLTPPLSWDLSGAVGDDPTVPSSLLLHSFYLLCLPYHSLYPDEGTGKSNRGGVTLFLAQPPNGRGTLGPLWLLSVASVSSSETRKTQN